MYTQVTEGGPPHQTEHRLLTMENCKTEYDQQQLLPTESPLKRKNSMEKTKIIKEDPIQSAKWIMSCNQDIKKQWDVFVCLLVIYNSFSIPFELSFNRVTGYTDALNWIIDVFFFLDIVVGFRTSFLDQDGKEIADSK